MYDFRIVADTSADLSEEIIKEKEIVTVPFYVMQEEDVYKKHRVELFDHEFYTWMIENPKLMPKSAAPSVDDFYQVFTELVEKGEKVLCICITVKFSSSYQNACIAKDLVLEKYSDARIEVVNSICNTVLQGLVVYEATRLRESGASLEYAAAELERIKPSGRIFFTIGSMDYLTMGGRIGNLAGKVSGVLDLRPIIRLSEGEIHLAGLARGRLKSLSKVLNAGKEYMKSSFKDISEFSAAVGFGYDRDEALKFKAQFEEMLREIGLWVDAPIRVIGAVIGVHTGPLPLGFGVVRKATLPEKI